VLVRSRPGTLSALVAPRNPHVGLLLPYAPLHHLLFRPVPGAPSRGDGGRVPQLLVMTSGNLSDEPLAFDDDDARWRLASLADSFCTHDRPIHVPCDDSVVRIVGGEELPIRRSRGYAPLPVALPVAVAPTLAVGGELKNTFCVAEGRNAWVSQHVGDMGNVETLHAFERSVALFTDMYAVDPSTVVADAHPGYLTHRWAEERSDEPLTVQHHHAHACALMAEAGLDGSRPVLAATFDGTGYGADGAIWGGELLVADYRRFERYAALGYVPLPGGDAAIRKPYRVALAHLWAAGIEWRADLPAVAACDGAARRALASMLAHGTGCVPTSSMGRLFDAVSSLLGVRHEITYEGQAAIELEHVASATGSDVTRPSLRFTVGDDGVIACGEVVGDLVDGLRAGIDVAGLAAAFHEAVVELVVDVARRARVDRAIETVGLTGGVFQNALLVEWTQQRLAEEGFEVLRHRVVPPNDGGLALGQVIAAGRRS
jgi:hydrogenase maturation protein HypF